MRESGSCVCYVSPRLLREVSEEEILPRVDTERTLHMPNDHKAYLSPPPPPRNCACCLLPPVLYPDYFAALPFFVFTLMSRARTSMWIGCCVEPLNPTSTIPANKHTRLHHAQAKLGGQINHSVFHRANGGAGEVRQGGCRRCQGRPRQNADVIRRRAFGRGGGGRKETGGGGGGDNGNSAALNNGGCLTVAAVGVTREGGGMARTATCCVREM